MFLSQVPSTPGLEVAAIADLSPERARQACRGVGWTEERIAATRITDDAAARLCARTIAGWKPFPVMRKTRMCRVSLASS